MSLFPPQSKAMRERWLLQGMAAEEGEPRQKQLEQDEEQGKRLEDLIHRWVVGTAVTLDVGLRYVFMLILALLIRSGVV